MERKETGIMRRLLALALCLVVAVTFIPLLGDGVYADETQNGDGKASISDTGDIDPDQIDISLEEPAGDSDIVDITDENADAVVIEPEETLDEAAVEAEIPDDSAAAEGSAAGTCNLEQFGPSALKESADELSAKASASGLSPNHNYFSGTIMQSGNTVTVNTKLDSTKFRYNGMFVDGKEILINGSSVTASSVNATINMKSFATGYHTVFLFVACKKDTTYYDANEKVVSGKKDDIVDILGQRYMSSNNITNVPNYNGRFYYVYSRYLEFYPFSIGGGNQGGKLFMEYSNNGGKSWQRSGYMQANMIELAIQQGYRINGLVPNKVYKTRLRYGEYVTYSTDYLGDGKSHFFGGPVRNISTVKTGKAKKPKIKSVKVKAVKVKRHKVRHYGYYTGVYLYTEKYYTYKLKVTVKLKKKPKAAGLWINGKFVKGNKKKYTATLPGSSYSTKKPKGKKFKVGICSYNGTSYGGFSPLYQKKKKIK